LLQISEPTAHLSSPWKISRLIFPPEPQVRVLFVFQKEMTARNGNVWKSGVETGLYFNFWRPMDKKQFSERDICTKFITPAVEAAGWDKMEQIREEVSFTAGPIQVRGNMAVRDKKKIKRADYILSYKPNRPIAIIEAKDNRHAVGDGMQQGLDYADSLDIPFVFSSNGDGFLFHDRTGLMGQVEKSLSLDEFPNPEELWTVYREWKGWAPETTAIAASDYYTDLSDKEPRYYQQVAINRTVDAIAAGRDRALLVMATGTGKTYTAFQIIWRLWKSGAKKRILFLADRNILVDQTRVNDFKPFGQAMTKISKRQVDKSYEIYLSLYQAVSGPEEEQNIYKQFSPDFFDLIVVDECHRGSAADDAAWRAILDYFSSAAQIGMTATPKETREVSNIDYFGEPIYLYSLKQGIQDGFLAPYKVIRYDLDRDYGYRPEKGKVDANGVPIEDRIYNVKDYDRNMVLVKRTELVARKISDYLQATGLHSKTIVFCQDINHAERMRSALVNLHPAEVKEDTRYVMRITGDENLGKAELDNFIDPESVYPVIACTSKLMTTGVDAQTCKLIVLDQNINSMTEFKQIIGRGTRIKEEYGKMFFTIMDFRGVTDLFADPDFDGDPVSIYNPGPDDPPEPPDDDEGGDPPPDGGDPPDDNDDTGGGIMIDPPPGGEARIKYIVNDVEVMVAAERVQYYDPQGRLITESLTEYTRKKMGEDCATLHDFLSRWTSADKKQVVIEELRDQGIIFEALAEEIGKEFDPFDLICHVVYDRQPLSRRERAENVKKRNYFTKYGEQARAVLEAILGKYADQGPQAIEAMEILKVQPISQMGTPIEIIQIFGSRAAYEQAIQELEAELYSEVI
jgi:type I restriction enzyme R subunit